MFCSMTKLFTKNIPSKIYEIMAVKKPILISTEGESRRLVESAGAGIGCTPENVDEMVEKILYLYNNEALRIKMGNDGFAFALANASRMHLADGYLDTLTKVVSGQSVVEPQPSFAKQPQIVEEKIKATA